MIILLAFLSMTMVSGLIGIWLGLDWLLVIPIGMTYGSLVASYAYLMKSPWKKRKLAPVAVAIFTAVVGYGATAAINVVSGLSVNERLGIQILVFGVGALSLLLGFLGTVMADSSHELDR